MNYQPNRNDNDSGEPRSLVERLAEVRRRVVLREWLAAFLALAAVALFGGLLLAAFNRLSPWQESAAFAAALFLGAGFVIVLALVTGWLFLRPPSLPALAGRIEKRQPEWMDSLICAVECELAPESKRRTLERSLIEKTRRKAAGLDFTALLLPAPCHTRFLTGGAALVAVLLPFFFLSDFSRKAFFHFADLRAGESTGLAVAPGSRDVPRGQDVQVRAEIFRWEETATIEYADENGRRAYPMHARGDGHTFTFYHVEEDIRYRVITPSLRSEWFDLAAYTPPAIEEYELRVTPPAYTRLPNQAYSELSDIEVIEGSVAEVAILLPDAVRAWLRFAEANEDRALDHDGSRHTLTKILTESDTVRFVLRDAKDREARTPEMKWTVRPDYPPTVEITQPARDMPASPEARIDLTALAADDFGLVDVTLHYSISGQRRDQRVVFQAPGEEGYTERTVRTQLRLDELEVQEGDVVTYFFTARDNREPEAQVGRSEVFFLEIREEPEPIEMDGPPMEMDQFDVQALIVEAKRLIRRSWEGFSSPEPLRERIALEVSRDIGSLQTEIRRLQREAVSQLGAEEAEPIVALLDRALHRLDFAGRFAEQDLLDASIPFQEMALADLVTLQNALMDDPVMSREPSEGGDPGQSQPQQQPDFDDNLVDRLEELLRDTRRLADDQAAQNTNVRRHADRGATAEQRAELQERQDALRDGAERIRETLRGMREGAAAQQDLGAAARMMEQASDRVAEDSLDSAARAGERARAQLLAAIEGLEDSLSQATHNQIAQLAGQAQQLAAAQGEAAGASGGMGERDSVSMEEIGELRDRQRDLQRQLADLLSQVDSTARELREGNPEASGELAGLSRQLRDDDVDGQMGRAGNALLYRRFDRAQADQEEAAGRLGEFAENLSEAAERMPSLTREQLHRLLSEVQRSHREVMQMAGQAPEEIGERLSDVHDRMGRQLDRAGRALPDSPLQEIGGELLASTRDESARPNIFRTESMLQAAARAIEEQIFAMEVDRRARLQRQASDPPEKYRSLVEEYFRSLTDD